MGDEADLIAAEHARRAAITSGDVAAQERLVGEPFHYAHISGLIEDRESYFARVRAGSVISLTSASDLAVIVRPGYALMHGRSAIRVHPGGSGFNVDTLFTAVWERQDGAWKITAYASTPLSLPVELS